jgi:hypothetical protein
LKIASRRSHTPGQNYFEDEDEDDDEDDDENEIIPRAFSFDG